jgi:hypothetical protein
VGVAVGEAEGEAEGEGLTSGLGDGPGTTGVGVAPGPGWGDWLYPGSQLSPEPAKGSQVGEEPLNQTSVPGPRPRMKTTTMVARRRATTEDITFRRNAGCAVRAVPYDALTRFPSLLAETGGSTA